MEELEFEHITAEEYVKWLHIFISHIEDEEHRDDMIQHLCEVKDQLAHMETCYSLEAYEPEGSI